MYQSNTEKRPIRLVTCGAAKKHMVKKTRKGTTMRLKERNANEFLNEQCLNATKRARSDGT